MIRPANITDLPELHRMGVEFFKASGYSAISEYDIETVEIVLKDLIKAGCLLTDGKHGIIGFIIFPLFFNQHTIISQELFWWVDEEKRGTSLGVNLLWAAEERSKELGAKVMLMLSIKELDGKKINKLYKRLGYKERENTFMKEL